MRGIRPETCSVDGCPRLGEALVRRYEDVTVWPYFSVPTEDWIWLCDEHVREEFA